MSIRVLIGASKFKGGPSVARNRLAIALAKVDGIKVVRSPKEKFDIELSVIRFLHSHNKPHVLRADGCYYNANNMRANDNLIKALKKSKSVIFQSYFSKKMIRRVLGIKPKRRYVIHNGIDFDYIDSIAPNPSIPPDSFVACGLWRDNKRPKSMMKGFWKSGVKNHFYVIGEGMKKEWDFGCKNVHFLGKISAEKTISIMKACKHLIHLCYIDSCPNVVVEGLACGLNVLCTNLGGTREIVGDNGIILEPDCWDFRPQKPTKHDKHLSSDLVAAGIHKLLAHSPLPRNSQLDIRYVAEEYAKVIRATLK